MRYALLDRDGTIIVEKNYLKRVADLELLPGAVAGLRKLAGFGLVILTNQSGIGRGLITVAEVEAIHGELKRRLAEAGVAIAGIYYCPHAPWDGCECRKPKTKLAERAAAEMGFALEECLVVGDKASDIELGRAIGSAKTVLVRTGYGREQEAFAHADTVVDDLSGIVP